jgi:hypothetical protein
VYTCAGWPTRSKWVGRSKSVTAKSYLLVLVPACDKLEKRCILLMPINGTVGRMRVSSISEPFYQWWISARNTLQVNGGAVDIRSPLLRLWTLHTTFACNFDRVAYDPNPSSHSDTQRLHYIRRKGVEVLGSASSRKRFFNKRAWIGKEEYVQPYRCKFHVGVLGSHLLMAYPCHLWFE